MSKAILSVVSFVAGMFCMFFIASGSHAPMFAQDKPPAPQVSPSPQSPTPGAPSPVPPGFRVVFQSPGAPKVPEISQVFSNMVVPAAPVEYIVDGSACNQCVFGDTAFKYSGGNFQFTKFAVTGKITVSLEGAAKNTVLFLDFIQHLAAGQVPATPAPREPIMKTAIVKDTVKGSFGTTQ